MKICSFLWVYYGYPNSTYEGVNVEMMRYHCGSMLAKRDNVKADFVAGVRTRELPTLLAMQMSREYLFQAFY